MIIELKLEKKKIDKIEEILYEVERNLRGEEARKLYDLIVEIKEQKWIQMKQEKAIRSEDN